MLMTLWAVLIYFVLAILTGGAIALWGDSDRLLVGMGGVVWPLTWVLAVVALLFITFGSMLVALVQLSEKTKDH